MIEVIKTATPDSILRDARKTKLLRALEEFNGAIEQRAAYVVSTFVTRKVVIFAIIEAVAVYGFVLALVGRFVQDLYLLSALSLVLLVVEFPSQKSLDTMIRAAEQASPAPVG